MTASTMAIGGTMFLTTSGGNSTGYGITGASIQLFGASKTPTGIFETGFGGISTFGDLTMTDFLWTSLPDPFISVIQIGTGDVYAFSLTGFVLDVPITELDIAQFKAHGSGVMTINGEKPVAYTLVIDPGHLIRITVPGRRRGMTAKEREDREKKIREHFNQELAHRKKKVVDSVVPKDDVIKYL